MKISAIGGMIIAVVVIPLSPAVASECPQSAYSSGQCVTITTELDNTGATVGASQTSEGAAGHSAPASSPPSSFWSPPPPREPIIGSAECEIKLSGYCRAQSPSKDPPAAVATPPEPPSQASDLRNFSPGSPSIVLEPAGWSIPRVPTNMYALVGETREAGELLGWPIEVLFQPSQYVWNFGDGNTARLSIAGKSWGGAQFSPTETSHVYSQPGTYQVSLTVGYVASYRFDGGAFRSIPGVVWRDAGSQMLAVLRVTSVLVERGCAPSSLVDGRC